VFAKVRAELSFESACPLNQLSDEEWTRTKTMAKKKKALKTVRKAVRKALDKGVAANYVEEVVQTTKAR
jgi:hypothetical protein